MYLKFLFNIYLQSQASHKNPFPYNTFSPILQNYSTLIDVQCWETEAETQTAAFLSCHLSDGAKVRNKSIWTLNIAWDNQARDT